MVKGHVEFDITASLRGQLPPIPRDIPRASVPLAELPALLRAIDGYEDGWPVTRLALKTVSLTLLRFQEFGHATWDEIEGLDGDAPLWRVPEARMKIKRPHIVPLAPQAVAVLRELREVSGNSGFMFPSPHRVWQPLTNNALIFALYRLGYRTRQTIHGWRHLASTVLNENGFNPDWIEKALAHEEQKKSRRAYNAAIYLQSRRDRQAKGTGQHVRSSLGASLSAAWHTYWINQT